MWPPPIENPPYRWVVSDDKHEIIGLMKGPFPEGRQFIVFAYPIDGFPLFEKVALDVCLWRHKGSFWYVFMCSSSVGLDTLRKIKQFR